jgi:hypothetical protein
MIRVFVRARHLRAIHDRRFSKELDSLLVPLADVSYPEIKSESDLAQKTVFDVLNWFHEKVFYENDKKTVRANAGAIIEKQKAEIHRVAQKEYYCTEFECTEEDACRSFAIHGLFPHGTLRRDGRKVPAFLPDFSVGVRCFGFFGRAPRDDRGYTVADGGYSEPCWHPSISTDSIVKNLWEKFPAVNYGVELPFSKLECHLCDSLATVHENAKRYWKEIKGTFELTAPAEDPDKIAGAQSGGPSDDDCLVLDAIVHGFLGHRSVRRDNDEVPSVGRHRLLAASATRQGLGKPIVSEFFPVALWQELKDPVKHFVLQAAEQVGGIHCSPLYPNLPSREEMANLVEAVKRDGEIIGFEEYRGDVVYSFGESDLYEHELALRKLGLYSAFRHRLKLITPGEDIQTPKVCTDEDTLGFERKRQFRGVNCFELFGNDVLSSGEWLKDWEAAIYEYQSALYNSDGDIEKSLHTQGILDLYPLHKRILGLVEYMIIPGIKNRPSHLSPTDRWFEGGASAVYTDAFTGKHEWNNSTKNYDCKINSICHTNLSVYDGFRASLETEGNWLIAAKNASASDLASMLDQLLAEITTRAPDVNGFSITLTPASPGVQADQLMRLSDGNDKRAALMTLYLGKIGLMLRNAIEHGSDRVKGDSLEIDCSGYWNEKRAKKPVREWIKDKARESNVNWRAKGSIPPDVPLAAKRLMLTSESLKRCMVLISLVLKSCKDHIYTSYQNAS